MMMRMMVTIQVTIRVIEWAIKVTVVVHDSGGFNH
jgi:hypothetical protein